MTVLNILPGKYSIHQLADEESIAGFLNSTHSHNHFWTITRSASEISLICSELDSPETSKSKQGWIGFYFEGPLDFSLVGVLSELTTVLAEAQLGILAVSTFDTDYVFVPSVDFPVAQAALISHGYELRTAPVARG